MEPVADELARPNGCALAGQDEERGLKGVFGVVQTAKYPMAHTPHHRAVSPHQGRERLLVVLSQKAFQKLAIAQARAVATEHHAAQMLKQLGHGATSGSGNQRASTYCIARNGSARRSFSPGVSRSRRSRPPEQVIEV
jgi:hypothetical protein